MRFRQEHFYVLEAMRMFGGAVTVDMVRRSVLRRVPRTDVLFELIDSVSGARRVYTILDQLQTNKMVDVASWPVSTGLFGPPVFAITKRGLECLNQFHH